MLQSNWSKFTNSPNCSSFWSSRATPAFIQGCYWLTSERKLTQWHVAKQLETRAGRAPHLYRGPSPPQHHESRCHTWQVDSVFTSLMLCARRQSQLMDDELLSCSCRPYHHHHHHHRHHRHHRHHVLVLLLLYYALSVFICVAKCPWVTFKVLINPNYYYHYQNYHVYKITAYMSCVCAAWRI